MNVTLEVRSPRNKRMTLNVGDQAYHCDIAEVGQFDAEINIYQDQDFTLFGKKLFSYKSLVWETHLNPLDNHPMRYSVINNLPRHHLKDMYLAAIRNYVTYKKSWELTQ